MHAIAGIVKRTRCSLGQKPSYICVNCIFKRTYNSVILPIALLDMKAGGLSKIYRRHDDNEAKSRARLTLGKWLQQRKQLWPLYDMPYRYVTSPLRALPNWHIIGAQKSGTTSLYDYIVQHPDIDPCMSKEPMYYLVWHKYGPHYYRSFFPYRRGRITGEATTGYLTHPLIVAPRMRELTPDTKIIVIVRNPVDRAYSHYNMLRRSNHETEPTFETALAREEQRTREYGPGYLNKNIWMYRDTGLYADHLIRWHQYFPVEKMLIINYDDFASDPQDVLGRVWNHLGVRPLRVPDRPPLHVGKYPPMRRDTREELIEYFRPYNERLSRLTRQEFDWDC